MFISSINNYVASQSLRSALQGQKGANKAQRGDEDDSFAEKLKEVRREIKSSDLRATQVKRENEMGPLQSSEGKSVPAFSWNENVLNVSVDEAIENLDAHLSKISTFSYSTKPSAVIDHIASQQALFKKQLSGNCTDEQAKRLEDIFSKHIDKYAEGFGKQVGGFFEKQGLKGESALMRDAFKDRVQEMTSRYSSFINAHGDVFAALQDRAMQEGTCFASEISAAYDEIAFGEEGAVGRTDERVATGFLRHQLDTAFDMVKLSGEFSSISGTSSEQIGAQIGQLKLKFMYLAGSADDVHQKIFASYVDDQIDTAIDRCVKGAEGKDTAGVSAERTEIQSVISWMEGYYMDLMAISPHILGKERESLIQQVMQKYQNAVQHYDLEKFWGDVVSQHFSDKSSHSGVGRPLDFYA